MAKKSYLPGWEPTIFLMLIAYPFLPIFESAFFGARSG